MSAEPGSGAHKNADISVDGRHGIESADPTAPTLALHRYWLALGLALVLFIIYVSLAPDPVQLDVVQGDKYGHVFAYFVLMSWFANLYEGRRHRLLCALGFIALGIGLEFVQGWTGYRSFEAADMAADAAGVLAGWASAPPRMLNYLRWIESRLRRA